LQGKVGTDPFSGPGLIAFVWKKVGLAVNRKIAGAAWLQGTVWTAPLSQTTGWLIWHYEDGNVIHVPMDYGVNTARFWADAHQHQNESGFPEAVWSVHQERSLLQNERWLRLYRQEWSNPHPDVTVVSLDFASNEESPAAPFLVAVNLR
jgi:hypothetical protein